MNHSKLPTHFVETFDAQGNRTVVERTYPVQPRRPASPKPKKVTAKKPEPRRHAIVARVVPNKAVVAPATPVQPEPPTPTVEQPAAPVLVTHVTEMSVVEYAPIQRVVETVPVRTGSLDKYVGYPSHRGHKSRRNYGRKPRAKDLRVNIAA